MVIMLLLLLDDDDDGVRGPECNGGRGPRL